MADCLTKVLAYQDEVRIVVVESTDLVSEAVQRHDTWHTASAILGRTLTGTLLMAANLKGSDRLSVSIKGSGLAGTIFTDADGQGNVRGFIENPHLALELNSLGKIDVKGGVGLPGTLTVKKFIETYEPFAGQVELVSGELGEDFTYYMAVSEQTPSSFGLSVLVNPDESIQSAGGFMVQLMPGASEETINALEQNIQSLTQLSEYFNQEQTVTHLLNALCSNHDYKVLEQSPIQFVCDCSRERFEMGLAMLEMSELEAILVDHEGAETRCHFCNKTYQFSHEDIEEIVDRKKKGEYNV